MERLIGLLWVPQVSSDLFVGRNQFAYRSGRGSRDALAYVVLSWLECFMRKCRVGMYLSDVSGAFDRVRAERLLQKMRAKRIPEEVVAIVGSWLRGRAAHIVVGGQKSTAMQLLNQVFQGTCWGPVLWNLFYEDSNAAIESAEFTEVKFADDLNAFKEFDPKVEDAAIYDAMGQCQTKLHQWGAANQVAFDASKEGKRILSRSRPSGDSFLLLGVSFDCSLIMDVAINDLVKKCRWKLRTLLRSQRHFEANSLVNLYKSRMLGFIEYRTAAIYHASDTLLQPLDSIQRRFLEQIGATETEALCCFNLAPLASRRDIAMLGLIHRAVLGKGSPHFQQFFSLKGGVPPAGRHRLQVVEYRQGDYTDFLFPGSRPAEYIARSGLGLTTVYNLLPADVVEASGTVAVFQAKLQDILRHQAIKGAHSWSRTFSPRWGITNHPLRNLCP
jgi:hypothetical protein